MQHNFYMHLRFHLFFPNELIKKIEDECYEDKEISDSCHWRVWELVMQKGRHLSGALKEYTKTIEHRVFGPARLVVSFVSLWSGKEYLKISNLFFIAGRSCSMQQKQSYQYTGKYLMPIEKAFRRFKGFLKNKENDHEMKLLYQLMLKIGYKNEEYKKPLENAFQNVLNDKEVMYFI